MEVIAQEIQSRFSGDSVHTSMCAADWQKKIVIQNTTIIWKVKETILAD